MITQTALVSPEGVIFWDCTAEVARQAAMDNYVGWKSASRKIVAN